MSVDNPNSNPDPNASQPQPDPNAPQTQSFRHAPVAARVSDKASHGSFATGALVQTLQSEFVIDFIQNLARPPQVAARVVVSPLTMQQMLAAMQDNLNMYQQRFGAPPQMPKPAVPPRQPTIQEIYDELKLPDEQLSGSYANAVMIGHTPGEFVLDFITNIFPRSAVSQRIYVSAAQYPRVLDTLTQAFKKAGVVPPGGQHPGQPQQQPPHQGPPEATGH